MHYVIAGDGPPVFLLHGFPETWFAWRKQIPILSEHYRLIVPDLRGYRDTEKSPTGYDKRMMARDIYELMKSLGYDRAAVPDLPEALITGREEIWLRFIFSQWCYNPRVLDEDALPEYVKAYSQPGAIKGACNDYRAGREDVAQDQADASALIQCPTLALWGEDFALIPPLFNVMEIWHTMATNVRGVSIPECGHLPHEEKPEDVNRELLSFLDGWAG